MAGDHKCPVCNATFTRPQHVARHMRSHTGDRPYKCQHCGDQFARSDLLSRHVNKCHAAEKPATTTAPNRRKGSASASRATTSKQACDQCVVTNLPCDGSNPCSKCISRKCRCTYVKFHRQTAPVGPGHPAPNTVDKHSQHTHFSMDSIIPSEEYLLSHPQNAAVAVGNVGLYHSNIMPSSEFTFPTPLYSRSSSLPTVEQGSHQHNSPSPDQSSPDFATRYRAQAELLSRAGVMPHGQINMSPSMQQGMSTGVGTHPTPQQQQQEQQQQLYSPDRYSAPWGNGGRQSHDPMDGVMYHAHRPHSQAGFPSSLSNNYHNSSADQYAFRYGNREGFDDLSDSTSDRGHSEQGHSSSDHSFYDSPSVPQSAPSHILGKHEHHEGFSSAFGLMSLDDPNVLAGIASDGTPFFTHVNVNGENGAQIPQQVRDDMLVGIGLKPKIEELLDTNGLGGNGSTPREVELRELRDFWRQYMRTPLTGPHQSGSSNGFPLATPTPNNLHGLGQLENPGKSGLSKKLARVASLPSVKTPPLHSDVGPLGQPQANSQNHYHNFLSNNGATSQQRSNTYIHSQMTPDDLKSYEQAVLARKAPTLSLVPRKRPGTSSGDPSSGGRFSNPSTTASSPVVSQQSLENRATDTGTASSRPSSADSSSSADGVGRRPSYKRMPSTTLGPANSKRTLLSVEGGEWSGTDGHETRGILGDVLTAEPTSTMLNHQINALVAQQDRHRRMSAPVAAHDHK